MTGAVPSRTCCTERRARAGLHSARQITAQGLCISPELARWSSRGAVLAGHPGAGAGGQERAGHLARRRPRGARQSGPHRGRGPPGPVRCGQGWTGPLGPRSRRNDYMIANVVVAGKISMSAAASTPVYFGVTGADAPRGAVEGGVPSSFRARPTADRGTGAKWVRTLARLTWHRASALTGP